jgi:hypothetical protein
MFDKFRCVAGALAFAHVDSERDSGERTLTLFENECGPEH